MAEVLKRFRDAETWRLYDAGDDWQGSERRFQELSEGGYVRSGLIAHDAEENAADAPTAPQTGTLDGLTVAQLRELAKERGLDVPRRASKARLLETLGA